jgi:hypothetical protein
MIQLAQDKYRQQGENTGRKQFLEDDDDMDYDGQTHFR